MFPSSSFLCLSGRILRVVKFLRRFHIHVCYSIYVGHMQMLCYLFVCIICVPYVLCLCIYPIVPHTLCHRFYILICIFHLGYVLLVFRLFVEKSCLWIVGLFLGLCA